MMTTSNPKEDQLTTSQLYRPEDISNTKLFLILLSGFLFFVLLLVILILAFSSKPEAKTGGPGEEIRKQRAVLTAREDSVLTQYALIDPAKGIYRIPIDSAMVIMLREASSLNPSVRK